VEVGSFSTTLEGKKHALPQIFQVSQSLILRGLAEPKMANLPLKKAQISAVPGDLQRQSQSGKKKPNSHPPREGTAGFKPEYDPFLITNAT
jgi:hypothetical protein